MRRVGRERPGDRAERAASVVAATRISATSLRAIREAPAADILAVGINQRALSQRETELF